VAEIIKAGKNDEKMLYKKAQTCTCNHAIEHIPLPLWRAGTSSVVSLLAAADRQLFSTLKNTPTP
jgi:hypothetical protein